MSVNRTLDISTATYVQNSIATEDLTPREVVFNNDGTKMYVVGDAGNDIGEYSLSTAFDISTAAYAGVAERFM